MTLALLFLLGGIVGGALGWLGRKRSAALTDAVAELARPGTAVLMVRDQVVSRRRIKGPQAEIVRAHGRGTPDAFAYIGRNDAGEHVFRLVER